MLDTFFGVESCYLDTFCIVTLLYVMDNNTGRMGHNIKCLSWDFYTDIIIPNTWDVSGLDLCVGTEKKLVLGEEEKFQDWNHVIKIMSDQKRWSRNAFILLVVILNWAARQEWMGKNKAISNFSKTREIVQGHTVVICVCVLKKSAIKHCDFGSFL